MILIDYDFSVAAAGIRGIPHGIPAGIEDFPSYIPEFLTIWNFNRVSNFVLI
jgi:hypothetical protein